MGVRDDLQADLAEAFDAEDELADTMTEFTGSREVTGEYDPANPAGGTSTVTYSGRGVFGDYARQEVDGQHILATDTQLLALQNEVTLDADGSPATPQVNDTINGMTVINVGKDSASATWDLQLRRT